jgi:hypothetical protein
VRARQSSERGFVAIEWVAAVALLLLPMVVLVASLPAWVERHHTATIVAREVARVLAHDWPTVDEARVNATVAAVASDHGIDAADIRVRLESMGIGRGGVLRVTAVIEMPAFGVPGVAAPAWRHAVTAVRRIDDYRSR